jgi:signal transduction histidine kinase
MECGVPGLAERNRFWIIVLSSLVLAQVAASLLMRRGETLTVASDLIQGTLLLVATAAFLLKTGRAQSPFRTRLFWILMSAGMVLWLTYQGMWNYFEVIKHTDVPNPFLGDVVLFLHLVPMIAALAVLPHLREDERDDRVRLLDFALLFTWWIFFYAYFVVPWQTVAIDEIAYSANFNLAYLIEKLMLLIAVAALAYTAQGGWRQLYGQLLGASALYASSSYVANWAIGHKTYYSGSIYDIPLTVSIAWLAAVPALAARLDLSESKPSKPVLGVWITRLSMLALFSLPWVALHAENDSQLPEPVRSFRITVSLLALVLMGIMAFWRQRLLGAELSYFVDQSRRSLEELQTLQDQLLQSEKMASLGQLVGGAAHEINNPLTAMLGYSELLSASNLPPLEQQQATRIGDQVRRTKALVGSLLTFACQAPTQLSPVDINSVLQTANRLLAPQLEAQAVAVRLELGPSLPPVRADSNQLLHVCLHLAGLVCAQLNSETHSALVMRTHQEGKVWADFFAETPSVGSPSFGTPLTSEGANKPSTLSLSACCRIVEGHGGRLWQSSNPAIPAFRMEVPEAAKSAPVQPSRAAARSGS